jgi:hypothetical protein
MNSKHSIIVIIVVLSLALFLSCSDELYDIAKNADRSSEVFALADNGLDLILLRATEFDVSEYPIMGENNVNWGAGLLLQVSGDGTAWAAFIDIAICSWVIYRSDGSNYNRWIKMGKEFGSSGQVSAITTARGRMYVYYDGAVDQGLWEFDYSTERFVDNVGSVKSLFHSKYDGMLYMTVDGGGGTEIYNWDFSSPTLFSYNSNAFGQVDSIFSAKYGSEFFIGYEDRLVVDHNGGTTSFPDQLVPSFWMDNYTIQSYAFVSEGIFAASTNVTQSSADIIYFNEVAGLFEVFRNISSEPGIAIKLLSLGGNKLAAGIRGSSEVNGLHLYDYKYDELKSLSVYDVYDIAVRQ